MTSDSALLWQVLYQFFVWVALVFAVLGVAVGVALILASARTLRFFHVMNRWISTRGALRLMEIPRSTEQFSHRNRRWIGGALMAGGAFAMYGLIAGVDAGAFAALFAKAERAVVLAIVTGTLKWFLFAGSVAGVLVGLLLCFFPERLTSIEKYANRWFSVRRALRGSDDVHLTLDRLVEAHPALSGGILACTALGALAYALSLLWARP
jgi:hypothetical protein